MNRSVWLVLCVVMGTSRWGAAQAPRDGSKKKPEIVKCLVVDSPSAASIRVRVPDHDSKLVVRLENPPRTRVTLSIDNDSGNHHELVWDPAINDGLQHDVILAGGYWTLTPSGEQDRVTTESMVVTYYPSFEVESTHVKGAGAACTRADLDACLEANASTGNERQALASCTAERNRRCAELDAKFKITNRQFVTSTAKDSAGLLQLTGVDKETSFAPAHLLASCQKAKRTMKEVLLDRRKVKAAANARGLLDRVAPEPVVATLALLAEIAIERARDGALDLVRDKFVEPLCNELSLGLLRIGRADERALPRTCALVEQLRLEDVLGSGHALLRALEQDVRGTLLPALINSLPSLDEQARTLAHLALNFASRAIDGHTDGVVEIDYLVALLEATPADTGLDRSPRLVHRWFEFLISNHSINGDKLKRAIIDAVLPEGFDEPARFGVKPWKAVTACKGSTTTGASYKQVPRDQCITAIIQWLEGQRQAAGGTWTEAGVQAGMFNVGQAFSATSHLTRGARSFGAWAIENVLSDASELSARLAEAEVANGVAASCATRLVVAIAKWCSARETCTAGEVAKIVRDPRNVFVRDSEDLLCWESDDTYRRPDNIQPYIDLGARLIAFLDPAPKGGEKARILATIHWMFDAVKAMSPNGGEIRRIEEIIDFVAQKDFMSALSSSIALAQPLICPHRAKGEHDSIDTTCTVPPAARKAMQLVGAVASYANTYKETEKLDPATAKEARKKALERLIDSATDRRDRARHTVLSLGSNVGLSYTATDLANEYSSGDATEIAVRIPAGLAVQRLPGTWDSEEGGVLWPVRWLVRHVGLHAGLQFVDLGQFVRTSSDGKDVTWSSFVAPGAEIGLLIGSPHRTLTLTAHASYAPTLVEDAPGVWRYGISLGYYVPFFDLN